MGRVGQHRLHLGLAGGHPGEVGFDPGQLALLGGRAAPPPTLGLGPGCALRLVLPLLLLSFAVAAVAVAPALPLASGTAPPSCSATRGVDTLPAAIRRSR